MPPALESSEIFKSILSITDNDKFPTWHAPSIPWYFRKTASCIYRNAEKQPKRTLLIGVTGLAGTGKDTATVMLTCMHHLLKNFDETGVNNNPSPYTSIDETLTIIRNTHVVPMSFADPLKEIACVVGFTREQVHNQSLKNKVDDFWGITPRKFLQMCGTEMFRKVWRDDVWVEIMRKRIHKYSNEFYKDETKVGAVIIPDVRFPNEVAMIQEEGGTVVRITREGISQMNHDSENQISSLPVDLEIKNDCQSPEEWTVKFTTKLCQYLTPSTYYE